MSDTWNEADDAYFAIHSLLEGREDLADNNALVFFAANIVGLVNAGSQSVDPKVAKILSNFVDMAEEVDAIIQLALGPNYIQDYLESIGLNEE